MTDKKVALKAIKIALLGDSEVGKTALCRALMDYNFEPEVISTIGNVKLEKKYKLKDGNEIKLILWDTAGQERFRSIALNSLKAVMGLIVVFDVTKRDSFKNLTLWLNEIKENLHDPFLVLFGNKIDKEKKDWQVTHEEALDFASERDMVYFETSAKTKAGIDEGFSYLINEVYEKIIGTISENENKEKENIIILENPEEKKESKEEEEEYTYGCFGRKKKKKKKNNKNTKEKKEEKI